MTFLLGLLKPLAFDFLVKRVSGAAAKLISKRETVEDVAINILFQIAAVTPNKKDDKWVAFANEIKGEVRSLIAKIKAFRESY